jgi:hypothetical protein
MSEDGGLDLSGDWAGTYAYPFAKAPVPFTAKLTERDGWLSGVMEENSVIAGGPPRRRSASVEGRRVGFEVTWLKMYEDRTINHDVDYKGVVSADGLEITGTWSIVGNWSGPFVMRRKAGAALALEREATADLEA